MFLQKEDFYFLVYISAILWIHILCRGYNLLLFTLVVALCHLDLISGDPFELTLVYSLHFFSEHVLVF